MKHNLLLYLDQYISILREGSGLSIVIVPTVKLDWEVLNKKAEHKKIKLHYIHDDSTSTIQAICMGFGGFLQQEIPLAIKEFSEIFLKEIK